MKIKLGLIQMKVEDNREDNIRKAEENIRKAKALGAELIILPEMFTTPYKNDNFPVFMEEYPGPTNDMLSKVSKELDVYIVGGSIPEGDGGRIYNTSYVYNNKGELIGKHRKAHMFDIDVKGKISFKESDTLSPGNESTLFDINGIKMGLIICYDIRFPEFSRKLSLSGAKAIIVPAAFNMTTGPAHWHLSARARALDNQVYVMMCSQSRNEGGVYVAYGNSLVVSPWGDVIDSLDEKEGILITEIETEYIERVREELPLLKHRREEIY